MATLKRTRKALAIALKKPPIKYKPRGLGISTLNDMACSILTLFYRMLIPLYSYDLSLSFYRLDLLGVV